MIYAYLFVIANLYLITLSASDVDQGMGGKFVFSISGQGLAAFKIDPMTGIISTRKSLDRETKARYFVARFKFLFYICTR